MSRIDEALRRASGAVDTLDEPEPQSDRSARRSDEPLDYFRGVAGAAGAARPAPPELPSSRVIAAPRTGGRGRLGPFDASLNGKLVVTREMPGVAVEQYRGLAASVHKLQVETGLKTLMVTSALPQEGKTLTVVNLALTLSESYRRRVLLIDADLRLPSVHWIFRLPNTSGLSDGLRSTATDLTLLQVSEHLSILPAGQPDGNQMAGLTSDRMQALLQEAGAAFDWVLLDAPPVGLMPDAHLLSHLTQAVIFVIRAGSTPYPLIERAIAQLGRERIAGTVLNRAEQYATPAGEYFRQYYEQSQSPE
jgi:capsular exopolysaccharide synthesis family protein